ncbi:hypothetical protein MJD09_09585, partial [bacterium]|nr:hypothetical protein [bacterium]
LGLYSVSDLLQIAVLLLMLTFLSYYDLYRESEARRFPNRPIARQVCTTASVAGLVWLIFLGLGLARVTGNSELRQDHDFEEDMFQELERNLPTIATANVNNNVNVSRPWKLKGHRVEKTGVGRVFSVEEQYIRDLNERRNKFDPNAGLYYLSEVQRGRDKRVKLNLNRRFFRIRSPMKISSPWDGMMLAAGDPRMPTISALGYQFKVSLNERSGAKYISLDDRSPKLSMARAVVLRQSEYGDSFGELVRSGDSLFFQPGFQIPLAHDYWQIFINGQQLRKSGNYQLKQGDLLVFIDKRKKNYRRNLMYLGIQHPILSYVQWRNGRLRRMFPLASELPMAYTLGLASDLGPPKTLDSPGQLVLPLSMKMHTDLAQEIQRVVKKPRYKNRYQGDIHTSNRIALTVLDAYSGHILAMPDYPSVDPNQEDFYERILEASSSEQRDLLQNHNLKNHAIGSTIKPLVFASLAAQFHGKLDLSKLRVRDYCRYSEDESKYFHNCDSEHDQL